MTVMLEETACLWTRDWSTSISCRDEAYLQKVDSPQVPPIVILKCSAISQFQYDFSNMEEYDY